MLEYLEKNHAQDISHIVQAASRQEVNFRALPIDLTLLKNSDIELFKRLNYRINVWGQKTKWTKALMVAQEKYVTTPRHVNTMQQFCKVKEDFPVTFINHPVVKKFSQHEQLWNLLQIKGNVYRTKERGKKEVTREYKCRKCKKTTIVKADRFTEMYFAVPDKCIITRECKGTMFDTEEPDRDDANFAHVIEFQEIKIQLVDKPNSVSQWLTVELEQELVESCFVGDRVTICGTLETRSVKKINEHRIVLRAVSVIVHENHQKLNIDPTELGFNVRLDWEMDMARLDGNELKIRDEMVSAVAPVLEGLAMVKLGVLLVLCSGGKTNAAGGSTQIQQSSSTTREIAHLLMVGDPGLGKSQILKAVSEISTNAVRTVGYAATTAGLTANCYVEGGESHIEAGALVKANNGVCCLDELNFMSKEHRGSIHEVMEHQKISIAKAGLRVELNTKCSIIAGMNQKNSSQPIEAKNISIEQSLLSRFDLVFELEDPMDPQLDYEVTGHILQCSMKKLKESNWNHDRLQMHIQVAKEIRVEVTDDAKKIIQDYFFFCKHNQDIEPSRRTMRMWNSLERLTVCHAKLMLRSKAGIDDAVTAVMVMESSWSFGYLLTSPSVMRSKVPLGPTRAMTAEVLDKLNLNDLLEKKLSQGRISQKSDEDAPFDKTKLDDIFIDEDDVKFNDLNENSEKLSTQQIFSSQANNFPIQQQSSFPFTQSSPKFQPAKSFDDSFNISTINPPQSSSTQMFKSKATPFESPTGQKKESKSEYKPELDSLFSNLNSLAAFYTDQDKSSSSKKTYDNFLTPPIIPPIAVKRPSSSSLQQTNKKTETSSDASSKLNKFKYSEDLQSQQPKTLAENVPLNSQESSRKLTQQEQQQKIIDEIEVDEMNFFEF